MVIIEHVKQATSDKWIQMNDYDDNDEDDNDGDNDDDGDDDD